jgi:benzoyl-CoA 2,3-dioxygenase component B
MSQTATRINTFSDWVGMFESWKRDIGVNVAETGGFKFETLFGAIETEEIQFGHYKGRRKWENLRQVPNQQIRDALMNLIVYQGDTEFASVEQQRFLFDAAPSDWDRNALVRVMVEEMRHGWQMCALLLEHFGHSGKVEAQKLLERRAFENERLLGAFNVEIDNWLDFYVYTDFVDRDGKFQLQMLKYSGFAPLGRSMSYMLREEAFHMGTGNDGIKRVVEAGVIPVWLLQKYLNKWISTSYDLFGTDNSSSAHWAYVWGVKGRYDEPKNPAPPDLADINDYNRRLYRDEVAGLIEKFNHAMPAGLPNLYAPDMKFNRAIGRFQGLKVHPQTGHEIDEKEYAQQLDNFLPTAADKKLLKEILSAEKRWIAPKQGARDPLQTIAEPRKTAINLLANKPS